MLSLKSLFLPFCLLVLRNTCDSFRRKQFFSLLTFLFFLFSQSPFFLSLSDMECLFTSCRIKRSYDSERLITCPLCERFCRRQCEGITGCAADETLDPPKGLRSSCPDCRKWDIDVYKLCTKPRTSFFELSKNCVSLCKKFQKLKQCSMNTAI